MEVACPVREAFLRAPSAAAIRTADDVISYDELDRFVSGATAAMTARGIEPGDRIAFLMDNDIEYVVLLLAALRLGVLACPISTRLPDAAVARLAAELGVRMVVTGRSLEQSLHPRALLERARQPGDAPPIPAERHATVVFTSGSTGSSRAALHTFGNHFFNASGSNENISLHPGDAWLLSLPLYHVGGLAILFRCVIAAATIAIPAPDEELSDCVARVSHVSMVSTQLRRFLASPREDIHPTKAILLGGSAIPAGLVDEAVEQGLPIHTSYGLTEMASQVTTTAPNASRDELQTSGRVLPYRELRIDESGQIFVRGRTRFAGYLDRSELQRPFDEDGWFATGDLGRVDTSGRLTVWGRADNMFVSGGENIQPEAVEAVLGALDGVQRVVVVPVPDAEFGHRPVAFVESSKDLDESVLRQIVEEAMPRFMAPDAFYPWPSDVNADQMKVNRQWLQRRAVEIEGSR